MVRDLSSPAPGTTDLHFAAKYSQPFLVQCCACLWKQHWSYWRNTSYSTTRLLLTIIIALMFGTMFLDLHATSPTTIIIIIRSYSVQPVVSIERTVFYREQAAGFYSALPYAFAQVLIEVPYTLLQAVIYSSIVYPLIRFEWAAVKFFCYLFFMFFTLLYYIFDGMMVVTLSPNNYAAAILCTSFYALWNLFSGFIIPRTRIPIWWRWYYWACPVAWTLYGLVVSQYRDLQNAMKDTGETILQYLRGYHGFRHDFPGAVAAAAVGLTVLFAFIFAISMKVLNSRKDSK